MISLRKKLTKVKIMVTETTSKISVAKEVVKTLTNVVNLVILSIMTLKLSKFFLKFRNPSEEIGEVKPLREVAVVCRSLQGTNQSIQIHNIIMITVNMTPVTMITKLTVIKNHNKRFNNLKKIHKEINYQNNHLQRTIIGKSASQKRKNFFSKEKKPVKIKLATQKEW